MKIGDRVVGVGRQSNIDIDDLQGKIVGQYISVNVKYWLVYFDKENKIFHVGNFANQKLCVVPDNHGWFCKENNLKLVDGGGENGRD